VQPWPHNGPLLASTAFSDWSVTSKKIQSFQVTCKITVTFPWLSMFSFLWVENTPVVLVQIMAHQELNNFLLWSRVSEFGENAGIEEIVHNAILLVQGWVLSRSIIKSEPDRFYPCQKESVKNRSSVFAIKAICSTIVL
jgi:hypothetical protein